MSDKEILEKAIQKAIDGGWKPHEEDILDVKSFKTFVYIMRLQDFAKALWGEEEMPSVASGSQIPWWKMHLSQMVIADDPIKYLAENI